MSQTNAILFLPNNISNVQFNSTFLSTHYSKKPISLRFSDQNVSSVIYFMAMCPVQRVLFHLFTLKVHIKELPIFTKWREIWDWKCLNATVALPLGNVHVISLIRSWVDPRICLGVWRGELFLPLPKIVAGRPATSLVTVPTEILGYGVFPIVYFLPFHLPECCP
jgi:hypothetical protein